MPLRLFPLSSPLIARLRQGFHTSAILRDASPQPNHYETLQIPTNASPSEVKKSFYALSKTHHPDLNPTDPHASQRFVQISDAYATLSSPTKRSHYDSQILPYSRPSTSHRHQASPHGSYSSSNPAGGRPASGLSRRRAQFRGPPPSFYRSGGWGEHSAKRRSAQAQSGAENPSSSSDCNGDANGNANVRPGMGHGQGMFGEEVRHFDREEHLRTQENHDKRLRQRDRSRNRRGDDGWEAVEEGEPGGMLGNFLWVGGVIVLGVSVPMMLAGRVMGGEKKKRVE
ncbi:Mitochondrial DnaJ subfamily A member 3-like protein [Lachnellula arida]|uniref:Mitochondrial DnaJ subfamily A member 3-like protein n=1 Tax=Lachnellula arida TaxID=1316785 RepID=A0A8T9B1S1_9HELO|nr:Mitochondrial DnaJ subfamily A member 3-like protein [Lachnellula arida]